MKFQVHITESRNVAIYMFYILMMSFQVVVIYHLKQVHLRFCPLFFDYLIITYHHKVIENNFGFRRITEYLTSIFINIFWTDVSIQHQLYEESKSISLFLIRVLKVIYEHIKMLWNHIILIKTILAKQVKCSRGRLITFSSFLNYSRRKIFQYYLSFLRIDTDRIFR